MSQLMVRADLAIVAIDIIIIVDVIEYLQKHKAENVLQQLTRTDCVPVSAEPLTEGLFNYDVYKCIYIYIYIYTFIYMCAFTIYKYSYSSSVPFEYIKRF